WEYLWDGNRARIPAGLTTDPMELIPVDEPIIYRNFIQDAGSRAIAVGYPETVHLAFDANQMRLALLWKGAFIDARRHWTGRGQGFEGPQGTNVVSFGDEPAFAVLADINQAWPKQAGDELQFRGYRLDAQRRPEFLYSFQRAEIADKFVPVDGLSKTVFQRTVQIRANESMQNVYFRLGTAPSIQRDPTNGAFQFSSGLTVTLPAKAAPLVRQVGGESELLVPLQLTDGQQSIQIRYDW
ncbi:MAG: hypothetical protein KDA87_23915, partial [Planctomycetales bacterium]|nr:hypothetical protein [Planctomycetales bacterium]